MAQNMRQGKILTYQEVKKIKPGNSDEPMVSVRVYDSTIVAEHGDNEMRRHTNDDILVRDQVARKLASINAKLPNGMKLKIVFGYRHPDLQQEYFLAEKAKLIQANPGVSDEKINELTHVFIAVPDVAGHVVGGAIDVTIVDKFGNELDMGTGIADFSKSGIMATFSTGLTKKQTKNRKMLHDAMVSENFAPFYGEWWHFSYGDREWAAFYGKNSAKYGEYYR